MLRAFYLVEPLIPILIIGGIVTAIVRLRNREGLEQEDEQDRGIGTAKRAYFYAATFGYMIVAATGVVLVAQYLLDELFGPALLSRGTERLSVGVALALIWTPIWAWHRLKVQRFAQEEPAERRSLLRKLYVYLTLGVTAALVAQASVDVLRWVLGARPFSGYAAAAFVVWGALWTFHWLAENTEGQPTDETKTIRRLYVYITSACSLVMLAAAAGFATYLILKQAYDGQFPVTVIVRGQGLWSEAMKNSVSVAIVGAALWAYHWLYLARRDGSSSIRRFYSHSFATLAGALTALSASGVILFGVLQWSIGTPEEASAAAHFRFLPGALSSLLVGLGLWLYHWATIRGDAATVRPAPVGNHAYSYLMTALGLGALLAAIATLVPTAIGVMIDTTTDVLVGADWWRDRVVLVLTLGLLGAPVWAYHWFSVQRRLPSEAPGERTSLSRRVLVYGILVLGTLACLGFVSHLLFLLLNAMLQDDLSLALLREARWSMGGVVAAGLVVPYYWLVLREDRRAEPEPTVRPLAQRRSVTVLVPEGGAAVLAQIERALGGKVRVLQRLDGKAPITELQAADLQAIEQQIVEASRGRILLVVDAQGVRVHAYR